jgi:hypothetical protein
VTAVASGCGPVANPMFGRRLRSPPPEQQLRTSHLRADAALVSPSVSILVSLPLCFKNSRTSLSVYLFVTQEFM